MKFGRCKTSEKDQKLQTNMLAPFCKVRSSASWNCWTKHWSLDESDAFGFIWIWSWWNISSWIYILLLIISYCSWIRTTLFYTNSVTSLELSSKLASHTQQNMYQSKCLLYFIFLRLVTSTFTKWTADWLTNILYADIEWLKWFYR